MKKLVIALVLLATPLLATSTAFASESGAKPTVESVRSLPETEVPSTARLIGSGCIDGNGFNVYSYFGFVYSVSTGYACAHQYVHFG